MSTISSLPSGIETPQIVELRKGKSFSEPVVEKSLYTILPQTQTKIKGFMGSSHTYSIPSTETLNPSAAPSDIDADSMLVDEDKKRDVVAKKKYKDKDFKF
jgi:splicing factor 3B subunit 2